MRMVIGLSDVHFGSFDPLLPRESFAWANQAVAIS